MTPKAAYQTFLDSIFGPGVVPLAAGDDEKTVVTGAVKHHFAAGRFGFFAGQLEARLGRLNAAFPGGPSRAELLTKARNLAEAKNVRGAWCELAAYDFFTGFGPVEAEIQVPAAETLASLVPGRQGSSFDGRLPDVGGLKFEVKTLGDVVTDLVTGLCNEAERLPNVARVLASYPYDLGFEELAARRAAIAAGLRDAAGAGRPSYSHPDVGEVTFHIHHGRPDVATSWRRYDPRQLLDGLRYFALNHFDQLLLGEPTLLVYVVHPWFNALQTDFTRQGEFFGEFCRRAFRDLASDSKELRAVMPRKAAGVTKTVAEVASRLSAVLVLEDRSVEPAAWFDPERPRSALYARLYPNPNAARENDASSQCREIARRAGAAGLNVELCSV